MAPAQFFLIFSGLLHALGSVPLSSTVIPTTPGLSLRLAGTYNYCEGRVEVYYKGVWGTICGNNWNIEDARVVCRQLRCGDAVEALPWPRFGEGSGRILLDEVQCRGDEAYLWQCKNPGWGVHKCTHKQDATVLCQDEQYKPLGTVGDVLSVQLEGGPHRCAGRVDITYFASWRSVVCGEDWDINDAQVVCQELGCGYAIAAIADGSFGAGQDGPLMTKVHCTGTEHSIFSCSYEYRPATCGKYKDAAVICSDSGLGRTEVAGLVQRRRRYKEIF